MWLTSSSHEKLSLIARLWFLHWNKTSSLQVEHPLLARDRFLIRLRCSGVQNLQIMWATSSSQNEKPLLTWEGSLMTKRRPGVRSHQSTIKIMASSSQEEQPLLTGEESLTNTTSSPQEKLPLLTRKGSSIAPNYPKVRNHQGVIIRSTYFPKE